MKYIARPLVLTTSSPRRRVQPVLAPRSLRPPSTCLAEALPKGSDPDRLDSKQGLPPAPIRARLHVKWECTGRCVHGGVPIQRSC